MPITSEVLASIVKEVNDAHENIKITIGEIISHTKKDVSVNTVRKKYTLF